MSIVSYETHPHLYPCPPKDAQPNGILDLINSEKKCYTQELIGTDLILSSNAGDNFVVDLSPFLDDTVVANAITYTQDLNGSILSLSGLIFLSF